MRKYPGGTVIVEKSAVPETAEQTIKRIYNTDIKGFWDGFYEWQEKRTAVQCVS